MPFQAFNRPSVALLVAVWLLSFVLNTCATGPNYLGVACGAATVCIVLRANHLAVAPVMHFAVAAKLIGIALYTWLHWPHWFYWQAFLLLHYMLTASPQERKSPS